MGATGDTEGVSREIITALHLLSPVLFEGKLMAKKSL
jgi:hypothetical protein